jgi:hypothetical protein
VVVLVPNLFLIGLHADGLIHLAAALKKLQHLFGHLK